MRAYKFLRSGATDPYAGVRWPAPSGGEPGAWVSAADARPPLDDGVRGLRRSDLAYWVNDELWEIELEGPVAERDREMIGPRGRLLRRVEGWTGETARAFAAACAKRARGHIEAAGSGLVTEYAADVDGSRDHAALAGYLAAHTAGHASLAAGGDYEAGNGSERTWQSRWLAERLGITDAPQAPSNPGTP